MEYSPIKICLLEQHHHYKILGNIFITPYLKKLF